MKQFLLGGFLFSTNLGKANTTLTVQPTNLAQTVEGMGCGAIFYEGHITSLATKNKTVEQEALYDVLFKDVRTDFLQLMIRHNHEPVNDNEDASLAAFDPAAFAYLKHTLAICRAARQRNPQIRFMATLYTPPFWMKTNGKESAGGKERATIKPGMELELAEFCWGFLEKMAEGGYPVELLCLANEPDWPHDQPGYCLTPESHANLLKLVVPHFQKLGAQNKSVPVPKLVGPNVLSAVDAAKRWLPAADKAAPGAISVVGTHDYDRRGDRIASLVKAAGNKRSVWVTEWCVNGKDHSPDLINSAGEYWLAMTEAFNQGATAWMAYDWAYPPRDGGEALVHIDWGKSWHPTRIYHGYRQWCNLVKPGMQVVKSTLTGDDATPVSKPGVKAAAFLSREEKRLVIHVANVQDKAAELEIKLPRKFSNQKHWRTTSTETMASIPVGDFKKIILPARSLNSWVLE